MSRGNYKRTITHCQNISKALKKRFKDPTKHPTYGKHWKVSIEVKKAQRLRMIEKWKDRKYRETYIQKIKTKWQDPLYIKKVKKAREGITLKLWTNPEYRKKVSMGVSKANKGKKRTEEVKIKNRKMVKKLWKNPEYAKRCLSFNSPNKKEIQVLELLQTISSNQFIFTGNGGFSVGGKYPDFTDEKNKKLIEYNSNYWHGEWKTGESKKVHEQNRINYFKQFGYDTLIIWENELKKLNKVKQKILRFNNN